jgi:hypothetical protein
MEKNQYEIDTKLHMPTKIMIYATDPRSQAFPHAEYFDMTFFGAFRMPGMKNPGYTGNTFIGQIYDNCISYTYEPANLTEETISDPDDNLDFDQSIIFSIGGRKSRKNNRKVL